MSLAESEVSIEIQGEMEKNGDKQGGRELFATSPVDVIIFSGLVLAIVLLMLYKRICFRWNSRFFTEHFQFFEVYAVEISQLSIICISMFTPLMDFL